MSGPFHERALCDCGWTGEALAEGKISGVPDYPGTITVCPRCGADAEKMWVLVMRWHDRAWRHTDGSPVSGIEPPPLVVTSAWQDWRFWALIVLAFVAVGVSLAPTVLNFAR